MKGAMMKTAEVIELVNATIGDLKVLSANVGERDELTETLARLKAAVADEADKLAQLKREFGELDRRHAREVGKVQAEYSRLVEANTEKQREVNRLDVELDKRKRELGGVMGQIEAIKQKLGG
jgi:chromosome segregation ATPase